jgi:hypothetical protein
MSAPDAAVSTAETEMERLLAAVTGVHPQAKNNIRKLVAAIRASARNDALEDAAKLVQGRGNDEFDNALAEAIRAMKSSAPAMPSPPAAEGGGQ